MRNCIIGFVWFYLYGILKLYCLHVLKSYITFYTEFINNLRTQIQRKETIFSSVSHIFQAYPHCHRSQPSGPHCSFQSSIPRSSKSKHIFAQKNWLTPFNLDELLWAHGHYLQAKNSNSVIPEEIIYSLYTYIHYHIWQNEKHCLCCWAVYNHVDSMAR